MTKLLFILVLAGLILLAGAIVNKNPTVLESELAKTILPIIVMSIITLVMMIFIYFYLQGIRKIKTVELINSSNSDDSFSLKVVSILKSNIESLQLEVKELKETQLNSIAGNRQDLIEALKPTVNEGIADELEERFKTRLSQSERNQEIKSILLSSKMRLEKELDTLNRRSNLNLAIGSSLSMIAIFILFYRVEYLDTNFESTYSLLSHYIPWLSLVLFIEIFSFFFLRLYKATLAEMQMYQTEITALSIKHVAVIVGLSSEDPEKATVLSKELLASNSAKLESSLAKESEIDSKTLSELVQVIAKILSSKTKST